MKPFRAPGRRRVVARLDPAEAGIVGLLLDQLEQLLDADADDVAGDPVLARLLPDGHRGDPEARRRLPRAHRVLAAQRQGRRPRDRARHAARRRGRGAAGRRPGRGRGCAARNDLRLALGTRLEITEDTEPPDEIADEEDQQLAVYYWLTALQGSLVDALAAGRAARR